MAQEIGETTDQLLRDDEKLVEEILSANKERREPYWIMLFSRLSHRVVEGKPAIVRCVKVIPEIPSNHQRQLGAIYAKVDNVAGTISWEVNMHDIPFGYEKLGLEASDKPMCVESKIPDAYMYQ